MGWINEINKKSRTPHRMYRYSVLVKNFWVYYYAQMSCMVSSGIVLK